MQLGLFLEAVAGREDFPLQAVILADRGGNTSLLMHAANLTASLMRRVASGAAPGGARGVTKPK